MFEKEIYMQRALDLAALGKERVSPNPMVGCVIFIKMGRTHPSKHKLSAPSPLPLGD